MRTILVSYHGGKLLVIIYTRFVLAYLICPHCKSVWVYCYARVHLSVRPELVYTIAEINMRTSLVSYHGGKLLVIMYTRFVLAYPICPHCKSIWVYCYAPVHLSVRPELVYTIAEINMRTSLVSYHGGKLLVIMYTRFVLAYPICPHCKSVWVYCYAPVHLSYKFAA